MNDPKKQLENISRIWNHFFWEYKFGKSQINFNQETETGYFGDILTYFQDTLGLIKLDGNKYHDNIFYVIGLLQTIYVQQDLIAELLLIFKFNKDEFLSKDANRKINRELRNELIGHPIRRNKKDANKLISSVIFSYQLNPDVIQYIIYHKNNRFSPMQVEHKVSEIIERHNKFLCDYLGLIQNRINKILDSFRRNIILIKAKIDEGLEFSKMLDLLSHQFECIFKQNYLFERNVLIEIYRRKDEHRRYQFVIDLFIIELNEFISNEISWINDVTSVSDQIIDDFPEDLEINIVSGSFPKLPHQKKDYRYELQKLFGKHPIFGPQYFKKEFSYDEKICEELSNMEINDHIVLEYYSSYEYVSYLINQKLIN